MTAPPSPTSLLPPPPKRAPGVKRLNRVPIAIGIGVGVIFLGAVGYTMNERANKAKAVADDQQAVVKTQGSKPPPFLTAAVDHGEIQASLSKPFTRPQRVPPNSTPASQTDQTTTPAATQAAAIHPQSGTDIDEQARVRAWQTYYQQRDQLQQARFAMDLKAREGGNDPLQSSGGANSQIPGAGIDQAPTQPPVSGSRPSPYSVGGTDPAGQTGKQAFLQIPGDVWGVNEDLPGSVHGPKPNTIMEGTPIPGRLVDSATSDSPGQLIAEVMTNVYDDMTGKVLLVPQWSRIVMKYDTAVSTGQERMGVISQRLIFPDTSSRQIGSMEVADSEGMAGLKDLLKTHFWEKLGSALAVSFIGAGAQLAQPQQSGFSSISPSSSATGALTQQMSQFGMEQARAGNSIPNTIELRHGLELIIKPNHDITLPPYVDHRNMAPGSSPTTITLGKFLQ